MRISAEQQQIVTNIKNFDVIVDCCSGSGKTSTSLFIAENYPEYKILLLTYNKRLKFETRDSIKDRDIKNMEVQSFHSYFVTYYRQDAYTDTLLARAINVPSTNKVKYDIIIVDEAQDLTLLYLQAVKTILKDSLKNTGRICVMGDQRQSIYTYNGADKRFLQYIDRFLPGNWIHLNLTETFRLTKDMVSFINFIDPSQHMITNKTTKGQIRKVLCNQFTNSPHNEIVYYTKTLKLPYSDLIIIAPSLKSKATVSLANKLTSTGVPIYYPSADTEELDKQVTNNKIVFCTIHQSKGLERRAVILYNFDDSYHRMYNRSANNYQLSNEMYVALTRSSEYISLIRHNSNEDMAYVSDYINSGRCKFTNIIYNPVPKNKKIEVLQTEKVIPVTSVVKHIPYNIISPLTDSIKYTEILKCSVTVDIPTIIYQKHTDLNEQVSDITGTGIPAYYEWLTTGFVSIDGSTSGAKVFKDFVHKTDQVKSTNRAFVKESEVTFDSFINSEEEEEEEGEENTERTDPDLKQLQKLLYLSNKHNAIATGINAKMFQIENYNWITREQLDICMGRLDGVLHGRENKDIGYEVLCTGSLYDNTIAGYMDAIDHKNKIVYEFKCTKNIESIHMIQMYLYFILNKKNNLFQGYVYKIFNIFTGQMYELNFEGVIENDLKNLILFKHLTIQDNEQFIKSILEKLQKKDTT